MYHEPSHWPIVIDVIGGSFATTLFAYPSVFFHELGHVIAAKILRLRPTHLIVGESDDLFRKTYGGIEVIIRLVPFGGLAVVAEQKMNRIQSGIFAVAGPLANAAIAICALLLWPHCSFRFTLAALFLLQTAIVVADLAPRDVEFEGVKIPSDGKRLRAALFGPFHR